LTLSVEVVVDFVYVTFLYVVDVDSGSDVDDEIGVSFELLNNEVG
jgi:hypothetical protein